MKTAHQLGNARVAIEEVDRPKPAAGQVLIRTAMSAICGSEMHDYRKAGLPNGNFGHEAAGTVIELGAGVDNATVGQRVGVSAVAGCGKCEYCQEGRYTWCGNFSVFGNMHAEYFVIPALACNVIPDDIPWDVGVLITGDGLGVPYHTSRKIAHDVKTVAVFGLGPIGLGNVLVQARLGRRVIGIDRSPYRLELAKKLGATETIAADDGVDVAAALKTMTAGKGVDVAIEAAGIAPTVKNCFDSVRKGGLVIFNGEQPALPMSPSDDFIRRDITAVGSWFYFFSEYPHMLELARNGLKISDLITHRIPFAEIDDAFKLMADGESGKVLIQY